MKLGTLFVLLISLLAGSVAAVGARSFMTYAPRTTIVVASQSLQFGSVLTAGNIVEIPWASSELPAGAFRSKSELLNQAKRVVLAPMQKNEPVLASRVSGPGQRAPLSSLIEPGMRGVAIRVDDVRGVAGFVMPADRVDVILTHMENVNVSNSFADVLLQGVKVLAVDQLVDAAQDRPVVAKVVTLEVNATQAEKLALASSVGTLSLVLRQTYGSENENSQRVSLADLGGSGIAAAPIKASASVPRSTNTAVNVMRGSKVQEFMVYREKN